jgi:hypothetical protein
MYTVVQRGYTAKVRERQPRAYGAKHKSAVIGSLEEARNVRLQESNRAMHIAAVYVVIPRRHVSDSPGPPARTWPLEEARNVRACEWNAHRRG